MGCHKGEILDIMLRNAPRGKHFGFEPLPEFYSRLAQKYGKKASILPFALSTQDGHTDFHFVRNSPAYSGIKERKYDQSHPDVEIIIVERRRLDQCIDVNLKIDLIKIDVEGGELDVMKGAIELLQMQRPILLFESGKGASEYYGTTSDQVYDFLDGVLGYKLYTLPDYVNESPPLDRKRFDHYFATGEEYYYIAAPKSDQLKSE